ncbi:hypothetical protein A4D02_05075 [Niastella koreensis]|uniref:Uncharacterized protein n=2 Tax=Niastella koreensis TaxID=354356 RepID=G8T7V2_NIAKG|nr:hypothetical protein [Niastella koreensis]AEW03396.1 hypothetical protein Niako_7179 [Niastella koreensis GR20-10]OQP55676.1 hypothetical protein A4D02_05075 [Niastella koreensis]
MKTYNKPFQIIPAADNRSIRFSKPAHLIEKAQSHPNMVIAEIFDQISLTGLTEDLLPNWPQAAVNNTQSPYSNDNDQEVLKEFYQQLRPLVEALYVVATTKSKMELTYLTDTQWENPIAAINHFFQQFSIDYVRRELADFFEAGISFNDSNDFTPWLAWMSYNYLQCLTEAAYQLYLNQQMQFMTVRLYIPKNQ